MGRPLFLILASLFFFACAKEPNNQAEEHTKPLVYAVNYPLAYFAERIAGNQVEVVFPEIEGDPAFWEPTAEEIVGFQSADMILINGATYAKWLGAASLPSSRMVNTSAAFRNQFITIPGVTSHSHGDGEMHSHGATAFTTWLDPKLAVKQAAAISEALKLKTSNFDSLKAELLDLDSELASAFAWLEEENLIGSHPVYQYLERRYGLKLESVHWEPDSAPTEEMWAELDALMKTHPASFMLWEDEPLPEVRVALSNKGIQCIIFNPCGNRPDSGDFLSVMAQNVENLRSAQVK